MVQRNRGERLQIMLTAVEVTVIDDFRFANRMPSRAAAVRELMKRGLAAAGLVLPNGGTKSKDFGVVAPPMPERRAKRVG
jgi:hypothetical protein